MPRRVAALLRHHAAAASLMSIIVAAVGWTWSTRVAGGADSYGYVSQADLWLRGNLFIDQSFAAEAPWPAPRLTFTPLGYRPEPDGYRIVPLYSAGLPLLMATAKAAAGQCALFAVVPMTGGILVFATYWIGRQLRRPVVGLVAAWIVSTSAAMLFMLVAPMSDVPAAAMWSAAVAAALGESLPAAIVAGMASALAILIRPNLVPLAAIVGSWLAWRDRRQRTSFARTISYGIGAAAGAVAVAAINSTLYGSATASGYGDLSDAFSISYVAPNLLRYATWLVTAESPFALAGLLCLFLPVRRLWRTREEQRGHWLLAAMSLVVWVFYLFYLPWDAWWYLRFLLPAWPMMAIGTAALLATAWRYPSRYGAVVAAALAIAIGAWGVAQAARRGVFGMADGESKYVEVAQVIEATTAQRDVILTVQQSGSIRYYGGRLTMRWDNLDPAWLDRAVAWLSAGGHHAFLVLERQEVANFRARFAHSEAIGRLDWPPAVTFRHGDIQLFDLVNRSPTTQSTAQSALRAVHGCPMPREPPALQ